MLYERLIVCNKDLKVCGIIIFNMIIMIIIMIIIFNNWRYTGIFNKQVYPIKLIMQYQCYNID